MPHLFCFGLGHSARRLARLLSREGWTVGGTARSDATVSGLRAEGFEAARFDGNGRIEGFDALTRKASHLLVSIPPGAEGDPALALHGDDIAALAPRLEWAGYLSTTGVYGDRQGGWVDETSELRPSTERGRRRVEAETGWLGLRATAGLPLHVFRLAGIYGPGRNQLVSLLNGTARRVVKPGQVFGRIHVDDVAGVLRASMKRPDPGRVYNVCDDEPAPSHEVVAHAARLLDRPAPPEIPFDEARMSPMARSFHSESKRVSNARIKRELGVELIHPTYREGLAALLETLARQGSLPADA